MSIIAFASIVMTYFGVNFYLTGLHSYASGDKVITRILYIIQQFLSLFWDLLLILNTKNILNNTIFKANL